MTYSSLAFAGTTEINDIAQNMVTSTQDLPGLVAALSYLLGLLLGVLGAISGLCIGLATVGYQTGRYPPLRGSAMYLLPLLFITRVCTGSFNSLRVNT